MNERETEAGGGPAVMTETDQRNAPGGGRPARGRDEDTVGGLLADYELLRRIGRGGTGEVWLAADRRLGKTWAVKIVRRAARGRSGLSAVPERDGGRAAQGRSGLSAAPGRDGGRAAQGRSGLSVVPGRDGGRAAQDADRALEDAELAQEADRALEEAELLRKLDHPALPRIVDIRTGQDRICIIMDYIEGDPLDRVMRESGPQPERRVIGWARQAADVLWYLHTREPPIIYRDLKPSNLILRPEGTLKIIDFGAAREMTSDVLSGPVAGTRGYASPEHYGGGPVDARSDIYSLGMTMRALLTGQEAGSTAPVEPAAKTGRTAQSARTEQTDRTRRTGRTAQSARTALFSEGMESILRKCTAPDPADRYQTDAELIYALEHVGEQSAAHRTALKRKVLLFAGTAFLSLLFTAAGAAGLLLRRAERERTYELLLRTPVSAGKDRRQQAFLEAAEIGGADPRSYEKLLELFEEDGRYTEEEGRVFEAAWERNRAALEAESADIPELLWRAGNDCLYLYTGGDGSFRGRILRAWPYYDRIRQTEGNSFDGAALAAALAQIGDFYRDYSVGAAGIREPPREDYEQLLSGIRAGLSGAGSYSGEDAANLKLTMYREFLTVLCEYRAGMLAAGIPAEDVMKIVQDIRLRASALAVTREENRVLQREITAEAGRTERKFGGMPDK